MGLRRIRSREYKLMLRPGRFLGPPDAVLEAAGWFWRATRDAVGALVLDADGALDAVTTSRRVSFLDTPDTALRARHCVLRMRRAVEGGREQATLKFRHPDRFASAQRRVKPRWGGKRKFEEDIKPAFQSLYSHSGRCSASESELEKLADAYRMFRRLEDDLALDPGSALQRVAGYEAYEDVITGGRFAIAADPGLEAECALIVWHRVGGDQEVPDVVEFSFRYGIEKKGDPPGPDACLRAHDAFLRVQGLEDWVDAGGPTKTRFVYGFRGG